ncbi:MAG TPA: cysteine dioxygenase family protein [Actinomycetes bacterium]|nr:cysteine dioxygenase family protein [Actinomycetes bacterium]
MSILETAPLAAIAPFAKPPQAARALAGEPRLWEPLVRFDPTTRVHERLLVAPGWEAWVLTWLPGQGTAIHDHGGSAGAFVVVRGALTEETYGFRRADDPPVRRLDVGRLRTFSARHVHRVTNTGTEPAVSVHVYSPAIATMTTYSVVGTSLATLGIERAGVDW